MNLRFIPDFRQKRWQRGALIAIVLVGVFLRTYHFREWLYFYPDQARDIQLVDGVLSGKSAWPLLGPIAASTPFRLGPMYSYFQILSGALFGSAPWSMAYPDLLFGVLSIPLLYVFLRRLFAVQRALALTGLFAVSFYAVRYSRFAWNSNPIPFFTLLFLLALAEFVWKKSQTSRGWILALGLSLGVGVQLHTVLLVLLPMMLIPALFVTLRSAPGTWRPWVAVIGLALLLNAGPLVSEARTGFANTREFFKVFSDRSPHEQSGILTNVALDALCHAQANGLFLSSLENNDTCDTLEYLWSGNTDDPDQSFPLIYGSLLFGFVVFVSGYVLLVFSYRREDDDRKRIFLGVNLLYGALAFLVILPVVGHNGQVRYLLPVIFFPFLSLGLLAEFVLKRFPGTSKGAVVVLFVLLVGTNAVTLASEAMTFQSGARGNALYVVLGELERLADSIVSQSGGQREAYLLGGDKYLQNYYRPLAFVLARRDFTLLRGGRGGKGIAPGKPVFFLAQNRDIRQGSEYDARPDEGLFPVEAYRSLGALGLFTLDNPASR